MGASNLGRFPQLPPELLWKSARLEAAREADDIDPAFWESSAWLGHIPFAFWIVKATEPRTLVELGSHWGHSYFAFCQAIAECSYDTRAFAVDTWKGDRHADHYGEEVFRDVALWNSRYDFSTLFRDTFDAALAEFDDGAIDLLHIDGLHTYQAVRNDFENWLPKVSERGVVLLHDIIERKEDFGVWRLWDELQDRFPCFAFHHSHGLGIVAVGSEVPDPLHTLIEFDDTQADQVRALFEALGARVQQVALDRHTRDLMAELNRRASVIEDLGRELEHRLKVIEDSSAELAHRQRVIDDLAHEAAHRLNLIEGLIAERDRSAVGHSSTDPEAQS